MKEQLSSEELLPPTPSGEAHTEVPEQTAELTQELRSRLEGSEQERQEGLEEVRENLEDLGKKEGNEQPQEVSEKKNVETPTEEEKPEFEQLVKELQNQQMDKEKSMQLTPEQVDELISLDQYGYRTLEIPKLGVLRVYRGTFYGTNADTSFVRGVKQLATGVAVVGAGAGGVALGMAITGGIAGAIIATVGMGVGGLSLWMNAPEPPELARKGSTLKLLIAKLNETPSAKDLRRVYKDYEKKLEEMDDKESTTYEQEKKLDAEYVETTAILIKQAFVDAGLLMSEDTTQEILKGMRDKSAAVARGEEEIAKMDIPDSFDEAERGAAERAAERAKAEEELKKVA